MNSELKRVDKSLELAVEMIGDHTYRVTGGSDAHYVSLSPEPYCDCGDHIWRGSTCKHILASQLRVGNPDAIGRLQMLVRDLKQTISATPKK